VGKLSSSQLVGRPNIKKIVSRVASTLSLYRVCSALKPACSHEPSSPI